MHIDFSDFHVIDIISPTEYCVQINFESNENPDVKNKSVIIFQKQIKYIILENHQNFSRAKIYVMGDDHSIHIDFQKEKIDLFKKFINSVYNFPI